MGGFFSLTKSTIMKKFLVLLLFPLWLLGQDVDNCLYTYKAEVLSVYDADTVTLSIDLGFNVQTEQKIRLFGIDAPELRGVERPDGLKARDALRELILGKEITIITIKDKRGKYGRYLAYLYIGDILINDWLVQNNYAEYKDY